MNKPIRTRIYPGPSGLVFLITCLLTLAAALYTQANLLFWGIGLMFGAFVVSLITAMLSLRNVTVTRLLPMHGIAGEQLVPRYRIHNRSKLGIFNLVVSEESTESEVKLNMLPTGWILFLGPNQALMAEAPCWPSERGKLSFNSLIISCSFPFGILKKVAFFEQEDEIIVYPHIYRLNRRVVGTLSRVNPEGSNNIERSGGTEEFFGLREYHTGDSIRLINWKQTARTGDMVVKEMTQPSPPQTMVQLDLSDLQINACKSENPDISEEQLTKLKEEAISLAASIICDAYMHGYKIGFACSGINAPTYQLHHSRPHRTNILEALASLDLHDTTSPDDTSSQTEATVLVTLTNTSPKLYQASNKLALSVQTLSQYITDAPVEDVLLDTTEEVIGGVA
ncbi:DUF58 domain-containing protein [Planctomycetota bacterium]|nr:DUF58 domain-containing protein [Planctomycetota bacterium]